MTGLIVGALALATLATLFVLAFRPSKNGTWLGFVSIRRRVEFGPTKWVTCKPCKGAGDIDLPSGAPMRRYEVSANSIECQHCQGRGMRLVPDYDKMGHK